MVFVFREFYPGEVADEGLQRGAEQRNIGGILEFTDAENGNLRRDVLFRYSVTRIETNMLYRVRRVFPKLIKNILRFKLLPSFRWNETGRYRCFRTRRQIKTLCIFRRYRLCRARSTL